MARLLPDDLDAARARGTAARELETLDRLAAGLPDEFTVFHGVDWARADDRGSVYGEIDFLVVDRLGRVLAIEQKNGRVERLGDELVKTYASGPKSIRAQVSRNVRELRAAFSKRHPDANLDVDHLLYCPDDTLAGRLPAGIAPERVVDATDARWLPERIVALFVARDTPDPDNGADPIDVLAFLSDHVELAPDVDAVRDLAHGEFRRLSGGLATWVGRLSMTPFRLRVAGTAGSGKTQLALYELKAAHDAGRRALYVCFNRPLAERMRAAAPASAVVVTFHGLGDAHLRERGETPDYDSPGVFDRIAAASAEAARALRGSFDLLVIDEGQDIEPAWAPALVDVVREGGRALWLEDPDQTLYRRDPVPLPGWITIESPVNYRSPRKVATLVEMLSLADRPIASGSAVHGFDPELRTYEGDEDLVAQTDAALRALLAAGHAPADVAVVGWQGLGRSPLARVETLGDRAVRRFTGRYDPQGNAVYTDGEVIVETVHRFKGQSADCVIVAGIDAQAWSDDVRRRMFVAMTRARIRLTLVVTRTAEAMILDRLQA